MPNRLRSQLVWQRDTKAAALALVGDALASETEIPTFRVPLAPRDQAVGLLLIGAEVEHALMVQYLYAAYSLNEAQADDAKRRSVREWKNCILEIAREEMGHLATVQNLLTLIGGPLSFDREDYPIIDPELWPFPFQLEPLTKVSLGKYVLAEMPSQKVLRERGLEKEVDAIVERVLKGQCQNVHRVGLLYERIASFFREGPMIQGPDMPPYTDPHPYIANADIQADHLRYQATPDAWGLGNKQILVKTAQDRKSAVDAVNFISVQGEGSNIEADLEKSHFGRFLRIYRKFPEDTEWRPSRNIATNPTTTPQVQDRSRQIEGEALPWAGLFNLRYRMLLMYLKHSFYIEAKSEKFPKSPRGALVSWAFGEMYNVRSLSEILMTLPLKPESPVLAGPPFEMPYSMAMAGQSVDRWRAHRDLLMASISLACQIAAGSSNHQRYLQALRTADETALEQINAIIGA